MPQDNQSKSLFFLSRLGCILPTLSVLNLFFGWIFFGVLYWILIELALLAALYLTSKVFVRKIFSGGDKRSDAIDVESKVIEDDRYIPEGPGWQPPIQCPSCNSTNTRFAEPYYEASIYECLDCHGRFEIEE